MALNCPHCILALYKLMEALYYCKGCRRLYQIEVTEIGQMVEDPPILQKRHDEARGK